MDEVRRGDGSQEERVEEPHVRVMTDEEREDYHGITIDQTPDGETRDAGDAARASSERIHIVYGQGDANELRDALLRHFLGNHWKLKLLGFGTAIALAVFLFFIALPALAMFFVACGIVFLIAQLFQF